MPSTIRIHHVFTAPPERVYRAKEPSVNTEDTEYTEKGGC
jgi:hypothetical protein